MRCAERLSRFHAEIVVRRCIIAERLTGLSAWVNARLCEGCDPAGDIVPQSARRVVRALATSALAHGRSGKSVAELGRVLRAHATDEEFVASLIQAVRQGGITARQAENIARENGVDPARADEPARTPPAG